MDSWSTNRVGSTILLYEIAALVNPEMLTIPAPFASIDRCDIGIHINP